MCVHLPERRLEPGPLLFEGRLRTAGAGAAGAQVHDVGAVFEHFLYAGEGDIGLGSTASGIEGIGRQVNDAHDVNVIDHLSIKALELPA